ncbi:hypothetical protein [Burkholderia sp. BCC0405]|uniref:hypothetical protein n=1 Tax=Burkholderia sp. BCC0405 TaxID=2676298 RepID=UPI00158A2175|nr:hypothetical protein [Burkholderia sp. BCC0405]
MTDLIDAVAAHGGIRPAARALGIPESTLRSRLKGTDFSIEQPEPALLPVDELLARRKQQYAQKVRHEQSRQLIPVRIKVLGPIGILHFGDPHVDDDGTDLALLERHMELCRSVEGLYGANIGDTTNNWIGRLGRLYGEQSTSAAEAWQLAEWFLTNTPWLYLIGGNHDAWSGTGDPIRWIVGQAGSLYQDSEVRLALSFPNKASVRINARHDFSGHSIYNPVHGATKALHFGVRDHVAICGHKHTSGYGVLKDPDSGITMHAIQIASYKIHDRYAREKGLRDQHLSPCAVTIIDPDLPATHPDLIKVFWDAEEGADYLKFKRTKFS